MVRFSRLFIIAALITLTVGAQSRPAQARPAAESARQFFPQHPNRQRADIVGFLTGANKGEPLDIALDYLRKNYADWGLSKEDIADFVISDYFRSEKTGITHIYLQQRLKGIEIWNGILNINVAADGRIINLGNRFVSLPDQAVGFVSAPTISAQAAIQTAAQELGLPAPAALSVVDRVDSFDAKVIFAPAGISRQPIPVKLSYFAGKEQIRLTWQVEIDHIFDGELWTVQVDSEKGEAVNKFSYTIHEDFIQQATEAHGYPPVADAQFTASPFFVADSLLADGYRVYPLPEESPNYATPAPPADGRSLIANPSGDASANASPFGWHATSSTNWTNSQGNNVEAQKSGLFSECGATLDCDHPLDLTASPTITDNVFSAIDNLFYWNNIAHDVWYEYGFDEVAGNFQNDNNGKGGAGNDRVIAQAQSPGDCNAKMSTPADGIKPTMLMYLCGTSRDGDLDNGVIVHEYTHGITNRLTGGPSNVGCLINSEQMGEGWSDWYALMMTIEAGDTGADPRGIGTWLLGQGAGGPGVRPYRYSTNMQVNPHTYNYVASSGGSVHTIGSIWAAMLWEVTWNLIAEGSQSGFDADLYNGTGGNNLAMLLINEALKLQPCSPGFVDGRDAILLADQTITGGANQCLIWEGFAKRGLGYSADQGSANSYTDGTAAFDLPPNCAYLNLPTASQDICAGEIADFQVDLGTSFTAPVTLSAVNAPSGATAGITPNPVTAVPANSTVTISNTAGVSAGQYPIGIVGDDGSIVYTATATLNVSTTSPGSVSLQTPINGGTNVSIQPTLSWLTATQGANYYLEVATDALLNNIIYTATVDADSHTLPALNENSYYYWRVTAQNSCGQTNSTTWRFSTIADSGECSVGSTPNIIYEEDFESGNGGWVSSGVGANTWTYGATNGNGNGGWHVDDVPIVAEQLLSSPPITLPVGATELTFQFWNYQEIEDKSTGCYDGGILEISTDDGKNWSQINVGLLTDSYDGVIDSGYGNPLGNFEGWCGNPQPWLNSVVDIASYAGDTVNFRFSLGTDEDIGKYGWDIDDVKIQSCIPAPGTGVELSPDQTVYAMAETTVTHTVYITNTGLTSDIYHLSIAGNNWPTTLSETTILLPAGMSTSVMVSVVTPAQTIATLYLTDAFTLTALSQNNGAVFDVYTGTTQSKFDSFDYYLPIGAK